MSKRNKKLERLSLKGIWSRSLIQEKVLPDEYGISLGAVNNSLKKERELIESYEAGKSNTAKPFRGDTYEDINDRLMIWFHISQARKIPVDRPMMKSRAQEIAKKVNHLDFKAYDG